MIDETQLRQNGVVRAEPGGRRAAGGAVPARRAVTPNPRADAGLTSVVVTSDDQVEPTLLSLIAVPPFDIHATATAEAETR